jgi:hypothetical protein
MTRSRTDYLLKIDVLTNILAEKLGGNCDRFVAVRLLRSAILAAIESCIRLPELI